MPLTASCSLKKGNNKQTSLELWLKVWTEAQEFSMTRKESHPLLKQGWNHQKPMSGLFCGWWNSKVGSSSFAGFLHKL